MQKYFIFWKKRLLLPMNKPKKKFFHKIRHKYRLVILTEGSLEEKASFKLSRINVIMLISSFIVIWSLLIFWLIAHTPLKLYVPGYADYNTRKYLTELALKTDSLEEQVQMREKYIGNIKKIFSGDIADYSKADNIRPDTAKLSNKEISVKPSKEEEALRMEIEEQDINDVLYQDVTGDKMGLQNTVFFPPIRGVITEKFNSSIGHYGVDIAASNNTGVKAVLEGMVILANWNISTGNVIIIQHSNNLLSVYKHNAVLYKEIGNFVKAGEVIALSGGTGELSAGSHLHFELWYDGNPLNPQEFIAF